MKPRPKQAAFTVLLVEDDAEFAAGIAGALAESGIDTELLGGLLRHVHTQRKRKQTTR